MEIRQLSAFVAVARANSFTRAARTLGVPQPALSQRLRALERELGVVLVQRGNRTTGLTDIGRRMLVRAERILAEVHDAGEEAATQSGLARGTVRLGCALQTLLEGRLAPLLARFHANHPGIRLVIHEAHTRQVFEQLSRAQVDLALVHLGRAGDGDTVGAEAARAGVTLLRLYREPLVVVVGTEHRLARRTSVKLDDLRDEDYVTFAQGATVRELVTAAAAARGFQLRVACSTANMGTVRAFVAAGLGVAIVPASATDVPWPALRAIALTSPRLERVVTLARNPSRYESPAVAALRAALVDQLRRPSGSAESGSRPKSPSRSSP
jgi:DNA-binding transcriptional LysR family regulator